MDDISNLITHPVRRETEESKSSFCGAGLFKGDRQIQQFYTLCSPARTYIAIRESGW